MSSSLRIAALFVAAVGIAVADSSVSRGQYYMPPTSYVNPNPYIAPGVTLQQYLYNLRTTWQSYGQAVNSVPPWAFGYNPYPTVVQRPFYPYPSPPVYNPVYNPVASPYYGGGGAANPYTPGTPSMPATTGTNPYLPSYGGGYDQGSGNPYYPYVDPYGGGTLRGAADVMRAYGSLVNSYETARILREKAMQEKIKTARERFDHEMYVKNNTPTYTEEQAKIAKTTLKRIQNTNNLSEIWSGKSLNILLDDLRKPNSRVSMEPLSLPDDVLKRLNVTRTYGNLGLLRDSGQFTWPQAMYEVLTKAEMEDAQIRAQSLVKQAEHGSRLDPNVLKELRLDLDRIREKLRKKALDIPTTQYLQGMRFLNDFDDARLALENGEAGSYFKFQTFVSKGGKTVEQVVAFMTAEGLRFAAATRGDEAAYRAMHSALAAYDIAYNAQLVAAKE